MRKYEESSGAENFTALDYMAKTPDWAVMGHAQRGFDPLETQLASQEKERHQWLLNELAIVIILNSKSFEVSGDKDFYQILKIGRVSET